MLSNKSDNSNWLSLADMMTALMVIFMFIAINYIIQVIEHTFVEEDIYNKLQTEFNSEIEEGKIELGPDGAVRFNIDRGVKLFEMSSSEPTQTFRNLLSDFLPRYWAVLKSDSSYYDYIKEIRIEGHSDVVRFVNSTNEENYLKNLDLSQRRAANVLKFLRQHPIYRNAPDWEKERMDFLFTSIGFSYARTLNKEGNYTYLDSNNIPDNQLSRRVEFRIVTSNEKLIKEIFELGEK